MRRLHGRAAGDAAMRGMYGNVLPVALVATQPHEGSAAIVMLHTNPLIAFKRLCRLFGGIALAVACAPLHRVSPWFIGGCFIGLALMLSVIIPTHLETMRMFDRAEAERAAEEKEARDRGGQR
jgi:hypothetical protein